uniref:Aquaporin n=1 Tax=Glossina austeni TaxID=7395 RepID=A0A1A9VXP9_GLOAU
MKADMSKFIGISEFTQNRKIWRMLFAELAGTFLLVIIGIGSCTSGADWSPSVPQIAFTFGLTVATLAQCVGAMAGSAVLSLAIPDTLGGNGLGVSNFSSLSAGQAVSIEAFITAILVLVVKAVSDSKRQDITGSAPLAVGLAIATGHLCAIKLTGASMNPARSFGPAVVHDVWQNHWVYWIGPLVGSVVAALIYKLIFKQSKEDDDTNSYDF